MLKALVVDDRESVVEFVCEILQQSLQHAYDVAGNVEQARALLKANDYAYILLDLEIPASARGERARIENGVALFQQIVKIKGSGKVPIILMTSYSDHALAHNRDLDNDGLTFGMPKNLWDKGRPPEMVIRQALEAVEARRRAAEQANNGLRAFIDGKLVIFSDGATLCDRLILDDSSLSPMRDVLILLAQRNGKAYKHVYRRFLAKKLDTTAESLNGVFFRFRQKVAKVLKDQCRVLVQDDDVIKTEHGDHLSEKITVELRLKESVESVVLGHDNGHNGHENGHMPKDPFGHLGPKQKNRILSILDALKAKGQMTREQVDALANVGRSQVTRDLEEMEATGLVCRLGANKDRRYAYTGTDESPQA